jgi:hypothetical protein
MRNSRGTFKRILSLLLPRLWLVEGAERGTGAPLSVIWCGPQLQQAYILERLYRDSAYESRYLGRRPLVLLDRLLESLDCSLGIVAAPQWLLSRIRRPDDLEIPLWLEAELDVRTALDPANRTDSLKDDYRRIRRSGLDYHCASDIDSYRLFYEDYYLPTVTGSHGAAALPASFDARWEQISTGNAELVWVTMNGDLVSGIVLSYAGRLPCLRDIGIRDGDRSLLRTGAATAAYSFALEHLQKRGYDRASLGACRPFLDDGVLNFKKKWHPTLTGAADGSFLIRVANLCEASRSFLRDSSYIGEARGELRFNWIAANDDDFRTGEPTLDRLSSVYGIDDRSYIDVSGDRPRFQRAV